MADGYSPDIIEKIKKISTRLQGAGAEVKGIVIGQDRVVDLSIITLLSGGHALFTSVPGLAKTTLVETLTQVFGMEAGRVQFTPDTMPSDITGMTLWEEDADGKRVPVLKKGPVFSQLLLGDEINRANPRTQAALLQAMQELKVTIGNDTHKLPTPFHVFATRNPIEQDGTYPLPEAQLDRFLLEIEMDFPDAESEKKIVQSTTVTPLDESIFDDAKAELEPVRNIPQRKPTPMLSGRELIQAQHIVRGLPIGKDIEEAINRLVRSLRPDDASASEDVKKFVENGAGFRPLQAFANTVRAKAFYEGRLSPSLDDVRDLAVPVLKHRMSLKGVARSAKDSEGEQVTLERIIRNAALKL